MRKRARAEAIGYIVLRIQDAKMEILDKSKGLSLSQVTIGIPETGYRGTKVGASTQKFADYYRDLADEELLNLALHKHELLEAAAAALGTEMASRNLGEDALREFRERRRYETEREAEIEPQQVSSEPPVTTELPSDWFDDDDENTAPSRDYVPTRPRAATVLSLLFWLGGAISIGLGIMQLGVGLTVSPRILVASGILQLLLGVFGCVAGFGLWRMARWGRTSALMLCWVNAALHFANISSFAYIRLRGFAVDPVYVLPHFLQFLVNFGMAIYFSSESAGRIFSRSSQAAIHETGT